jgi:hypothetical protein
MKASDLPGRFPIPFGNAAGGSFIRTVPEASQIGLQDGAASLETGFPPVNFLPTGAGGVPPFGQDVNGILNQITAWSRWQAAGGVVPYDSAFSTAIGGYPAGTVLAATGWHLGQRWMSMVDDNATDPDDGGAGWIIAPRIRLSEDTTIYISPSGDDTTGKGTSGLPWRTLQKAWNWTVANVDIGGFGLTIKAAHGSYAGFNPTGYIAGQQILTTSLGRVAIEGDLATPSSCIIGADDAAGDCCTGNNALFVIRGFKFQTATGNAIRSVNNAIVIPALCEFGACPAGSHIFANRGLVALAAAYSITGTARAHYNVRNGSKLWATAPSFTITLTDTPSFVQFASAVFQSIIDFNTFSSPDQSRPTFSGPATGQRYGAAVCSAITTQNAGATYFPGDVAGSVDTTSSYD